MVGLSLGEAKTIAAIAAIGLVVAAIVGAWFMKELTQKIIVVVVLGALAALVWSQRSSLQSCADDVRASASSNGVDATCSFFGRDVQVSAGRS